MSLLRAEGLTVQFGGVTALNNLSLSVDSGELVGMLGANGSGKSTLLDVLSGLCVARGTTVLRDRNITKLPAYARHREGISRSYQNLELSPTITVRETLLAGSRAKRGEAQAQAERVGSLFGVSDIFHSYVGTLTYGTRKRVELARAFLGRPLLVLLDEPVAGLNHSEKEEVAAVLRAIRASGDAPAILLVEHDVAIVAALSTRVVAIDAGAVIAEGSYDQVISTPQVQRAYLGVEGAPTAKRPLSAENPQPSRQRRAKRPNLRGTDS